MIPQFFEARPFVSVGILVVVLALILVGARVLFGGSGDFREIPVVRKDIRTTVVFSGSVVPADRIELAFERAGRVSDALVDVGDEVRFGQVLMRLDAATAQALVLEADANIAIEEAVLETLLRGTRSEEVAVVEEELVSQQQAVLDAEADLARTVSDVFGDIDTAVYTLTDRMFDDPQAAQPDLLFSVRDTSREQRVEQMRRDLGIAIELVRANLPGGSVSSGDMEILLADVSSYLGELTFVLTNRVPAATPTEATVSTWQSNIGSARTSIEAAKTSLLGKEIALRAASARESVLRQELALLQAGATSEAIREQEARILQREATARRVRAELAQYTLISPLAGVVSDRRVDQGELAQASVPVLEILSDGVFDIEADVSELDLPFLRVGDDARVTFDAYDDSFEIPTTIVAIDPAEQIQNGIPAYGVTLRISSEDERIRPGLTANIVVESLERENVLTLPREALSEREDGVFVLMEEGGEVTEVLVDVGLRGRDGTVEIIAPLTEGDVVLVP